MSVLVFQIQCKPETVKPLRNNYYSFNQQQKAAVVQMVRLFVSHAEGRLLESRSRLN